jgi:2-oxoisovalerate dehydrogenase E1 component alpha subunit
VNNQWAISSFQGIAGGNGATFASRALGYGIPALRVDGNDLLAVLAVARWSAERVRRGHGPALIEYLTYRKGAHSTSDDPARYRPKEEADQWPLGDPIDRLRDHLIVTGKMTQADYDRMAEEAETEMREAENRAEETGLVSENRGASGKHMFTDVYAESPGRLKEQRQKAGF